MFGFERGAATVSMDTAMAEKIYYAREPVRPGAWFRGLFGLLILWQRRWQQRQQLAGLDAHLLRDIGVTNRDVYREASKPFWQA